MKLLYATDLHWDENKYNKLLELSINNDINVIINGGDILPKQCDRHKEQLLFINYYLRDYFNQLRQHDIKYLAMLGNDDLLSVDMYMIYYSMMYVMNLIRYIILPKVKLL
ncbi:MAG: hypothetical protein RSE21_05480 [Bacilli bacterium]